jgi:hypothetical protein
MTRVDLGKYFDILELPDGASLREVQNAYLRLKKLYSNPSIALAPLAEEFTDKKKLRVLHEIEEAYTKLRDGLVETPEDREKSPAERPDPRLPEADRLDEITFSGPVLRKIRERLELSEHAVSQELKLRTDLLRALEEERFEMLPQEPYLKGHLLIFARFLGLQSDRVVEDYLQRFRAWKEKRPAAR